MKILAIETSCDETAVAVVAVPSEASAKEGVITVLSNVVSSQIAIHEKYGGVVPMLAAREHAANIQHVLDTAIHEAFPEADNHRVDLIAVTRGPGLGPALIVGINFAKALAQKWNLPLVGVNHLDGHIHSNWLTEDQSQKLKAESIFPALNLIISGGHTELVMMQEHGQYEIIGETMDDAVGEAFDKVARLLDLGYPGGPKISKLALDGNSSAYPLPRPMLHSGDFNFSYSGLKTAVLYLIRDLTGTTRALTQKERTDIAASFQEAAVDALIQKTKKAAEKYLPKALLLSGGVSANQLVRERFLALGSDLAIPTLMPPLAYSGDNAAMIAVAAYFSSINIPSHSDWRSVEMDANLRLGQNT